MTAATVTRKTLANVGQAPPRDAGSVPTPLACSGASVHQDHAPSARGSVARAAGYELATACSDGPVQYRGMVRPAVQLDRISKIYRAGDAERPVLRDISVSIVPGEIAVLVGRSGSGKSTLLNLIAGIDHPTSGRVVVDGTDLTGLTEDARTRFRRRRIGFVFQFFNLIPLLTVEENVLLPLELNGRADAAGAS